MQDIEQNLDALLNYTQGLIRELQEKNRCILPKYEINNRTSSPVLNSFKQTREDNLKYKAWQRRNSDLIDNYFEDETNKVQELEKQWTNQKNNSMLLSTGSLGINSRLTSQKVSGILSTISKNNNGSYMNDQPSPFEEEEGLQNQMNFYMPGAGGNYGKESLMERRSMSAQRIRPDKSYFMERQTFDKFERKRNKTLVGKNDRSFSGTKTPNLKPSKSLSDIKNWNPKSAEKSFVKNHEASNVKDVKQLLKKVSHSKETPLKNNGLYSLIDPSYTRESRKDRNEINYIKENTSAQNKTMIDRVIAPFDPKIESSGIQEEISIIEPREGFDLDTEMIDTEMMLFSHKSSNVCRQGWILEEILKEEFNTNQKPIEKIQSQLIKEKAKQTPLAYVDLNKKQPHISWTEGKQQSNNMKTPMKNPSRVSKWTDVSNFSATDAKSSGKGLSNHKVTKFTQNNTNQKENKQMRTSGLMSVYDQVIGRTQSGTKTPLSTTKKQKTPNNEKSFNFGREESRGRYDVKSEKQNKESIKNKAPRNEGDRLYIEILEKLQKEKHAKH